jgi:hypothetical protein
MLYFHLTIPLKVFSRKQIIYLKEPDLAYGYLVGHEPFVTPESE